MTTIKASREQAAAGWARLTLKQRNSVVGTTFSKIIAQLDEHGAAPLPVVLDSLFDEPNLSSAHKALQSQFINRPIKDANESPLLKLQASRVGLKGANTLVAINAAFANAIVWFEIPKVLDERDPALQLLPNADITEHFTEGSGIDLSGKETVELAKSEALRQAEAAKALTPSTKLNLNRGVQGTRHGTTERDFVDGTNAHDEALGVRAIDRTRDAEKSPVANIGPSKVNALHTLLTWAKNQTPSTPRLYALLGDSGTGKTSHAQQFSRILNGEVKHADWQNTELQDNEAIPFSVSLPEQTLPTALFIDLAELSGVQNLAQLSLEEMLVLVLKRRDGVNIQSVTDVAPLVDKARSGRLIFVFDGLDELLKNDALVLQKVFEQLIKIVERRSNPSTTLTPKVIVSCRSHYFRDVETQHSFFTARSRGNVKKEDYRCLTLLPWEDNQIEKYLERRLGSTEATRLMNLIATTYNLSELASKPVLLAMMSENLQELLKESEAGQPILAASLYSKTVASWIDRDNGKHSLDPAQKPLLMGALAAALWNDKSETWSADRIDQWLVRTVRELFADRYRDTDMAALQNDLRTATFIVRPNDRNFNFAHKSYSEYFLARFMIDGLTQVAEGFWQLAQLRKYLPIHSLNAEMITFVTELWLLDTRRQTARVMANRIDIICKLMQGVDLESLPIESNDSPAPTLHAVLWQMLLAVKQPIVSTQTAPINLRGLSFSKQRWEDLDTSRAAALDMRGANLLGLYALRCKFGAIICDDRTIASQAVLRNCDTALIAWNGAKRNAMIVRESRRKLAREVKAETDILDGPWSTPIETSAALSTAFSPNGRLVACGYTNGKLRLWDVSTRTQVAVLEGHSDGVTSVAFNRDGSLLASASYDKSVRLWDMSTSTQVAVLEGHSSLVTSVAFNSEGTLLASASDDKSVRLWDMSTRTQVTVLKGHLGAVTSVAFNREGTLLASAGSDKSVRFWDMSTRTQVAVLEGHSRTVTGVAFNREGTLLASASYDNSVCLWDVSTRTQVAVLEGHAEMVTSVAFNREGTLLASASHDNSVCLWDMSTCSKVGVLESHSNVATSVAFNPEGTLLASAGSDDSVRLWDISTRTQVVVLEGHSGVVTSIAFNREGTLLASANGDKSVRFWDMSTRTQVAVLEGHSRTVTGVAFNREGTLLASASYDNSVCLWDMSTRTQVALLEGHSGAVNSVAFNREGTLLASASNDETVRLWGVSTRTQVGVLEGHSSEVTSVAFNREGTLLASASDDKSVRLWNVSTRTQIAVLRGHSNEVTDIKFNEDTTQLVSSSADGSIRLWDLSGLPRHLKPADFQPNYQVIVAHPNPPFLPSWASFDGQGRLLDWSESAIDHWLYSLRDGQPQPIESVL